ncbi:Hypothetical predicted protein [Cloeon dipterum]|uniref:Uncharacterized protein n=1 Tax=Cloeon dipterum TaxID=197152 RepID=A0A8S1CCL7_9INSE|nr:Hypothetical predicted protein [Cloeon dipterum]
MGVWRNDTFLKYSGVKNGFANTITVKNYFEGNTRCRCPNLEKLQCLSTTNDLEEPFTSFACLKEVHIIFKGSPESSEDGLLSNILSAPGLTKVRLDGNFEEKSLKKLQLL